MNEKEIRDSLAKEAYDNIEYISYAIGIEPKRMIDILFEVGDKFAELLNKCKSNTMHEITMFSFIMDKYKNQKEFYVASNIYGKIMADTEIGKVFIALYHIKNL